MKDKKHKAPDKVLDDPNLRHDSEATLDTGIKVSEAVKLAEEWWITKGQRYAKQNKLAQTANMMQGAFANLNPDSPNFLNSGLYHARGWDKLTRDEKLRIVKTVHHHYVRVPNAELDFASEEIAKLARCWYCWERGDGFEQATADEDLPTGESRPMCEQHAKERYPHLFDPDPLRVDHAGNYDPDKLN